MFTGSKHPTFGSFQKRQPGKVILNMRDEVPMARRPASWTGKSKLYRFSLRIFGPAQLNAQWEASKTSPEAVQREGGLQQSWERVERPDGSTYLVARSSDPQ